MGQTAREYLVLCGVVQIIERIGTRRTVDGIGTIGHFARRDEATDLDPVGRAIRLFVRPAERIAVQGGTQRDTREYVVASIAIHIIEG